MLPIAPLREIEVALMEEPTVLDCAVRARQSEHGSAWTIAYVVPSGAFPEEAVQANLRSIFPDSPLPDQYALLSSLPFSMDGTLDEEALARLEIPDQQRAKILEQKLSSIAGIERAAVLIEPRVSEATPFHISDLLPKELAAPGTKQSFSLTSEATGKAGSASKRRAMRRGEPLRDSQLVPPTLQKALKRAAEAKPVRDIICVEAEGREIIHTYQELLEDAERILAGLRSLKLRPGDKVIFQLDRNQDFLPAFWGCVLGGFIPAPISIAPTYVELNSTISKLHHSWEMLENPTILTREGLLGNVRNVAELLNLENFRVEAIEQIRAAAPDRDWHESQPDDTCLILLTSGSTGLPKGVLQSHQSLMNRSAATAQLNHFDETDIYLNWFPLDHVGGIVMYHLMALFTGARQIHAPTEVILEEPLKWLDLIERYRATVTWAPNFAFGLINDREKQLELRRWDLSCMKFILNGGEAIVPRTTRKFLQLLAKHGLPAEAMHPAWGMSETCSGVTFSDRCSLDTLGDEQSFVEVGTPIPDVAIRIVDGQDRTLEEGQIGRLQVTGPPVTTGYYKNPELNRECFSADGWFNTGDLGVLQDGRLTITGRAKDVIIVNGLNFYSHEVEAVVEEVEGVEVSFTAACPVRVGEKNTDQLAIFFHTQQKGWPDVLRLAKSIREMLVRKMGVKAEFLIPLSQEEIPKTAIGKIQRSKLRERFESGEFQELLKQIDMESANSNTLPGWFHQECWVRRESAVHCPSLRKGTYLVFSDELGLADHLCRELRSTGSRCIQVRMGHKLEQVAAEEYRLDPTAVAEYQQLLEMLGARGLEFDHLMHFWSYGGPDDGCTSLSSLRESQDRGTYSVLSLVQAVATRESPAVQLFVVTDNAQMTSSDQKIVRPELATVRGLLSTAELELPWLACRHLDLEIDSHEANVKRVLSELKIKTRKTKVAYRGGQRLEALLARVDMLDGPRNPLPIKSSGLYMITGGLGGLGVELARYLTSEHRAKLVLVGRTAIPDAADCRADGLLAKRIKNYSAIREMSHKVQYEVLDIADVDKVRECVANAEIRWKQPLAGVFHLAGSLGDSRNLKQHWEGADEHLISAEKVLTFERIYRSKVYGTWALFEALKDRPDTLFVAFSSVNALFGGATFSAYSAANAFLDCFCLYQRYRSHPRTFSFNWSMWDELGMSEASPEFARELAHNMGYHILQKEQGIQSMRAGLCRNHPQLVVGVDSSSPRHRRHLDAHAYPLTQLSAFYVAKDGAPGSEDLKRLAFTNSLPHVPDCRFVEIPEMPLTESGEIDERKLMGVGGKTAELGEKVLPPSSEIENQVAQLWREVLNLPQVSLNDTFFELGGDSLSAVRFLNRLRERFGVRVSIRKFFEMPTIPQLARAVGEELGEERRDRDDQPLAAEELLSRINEISDVQVNALLQEMTGSEFAR
jgi:acyl-CoA synthetase (AMP-forming)/AMP-acid ligase II/NAD(P)-dependent dehydrogenase (short-subunit alcohol dehydrogenase family)/acyl carrier protein